MTSPNDPDPVTLAKLAAQLDPKLACDNPAKAIELARKLLIAADPELVKQEADRAEEMALQAEGMQVQKAGQRHDELFLHEQIITVAEAFKALPPGHYKTEPRFAVALLKANLTTRDRDVTLEEWRKASPSERDEFIQSARVTSLKAVQKLLSRKAKQDSERKRKAASKKKNQKNVAESKGQKAEQISRKAERNRKKAEATEQKAEAPESS